MEHPLPGETPLSASHLLHEIGRYFLDTILPPRCMRCGALTSTPNQLCATCWRPLTFITDPLCKICGLPFPHPVGIETKCGTCMAYPPLFTKARSVMRYDDGSRPLLLAFKHADRTDAAPLFARWMTRAGTSLLNQTDLLIPVPIHWRRLLERRYNQANLLAAKLSAYNILPYAPNLLRRAQFTPKLGGLNRTERQNRLRNAIILAENKRHLVRDRRILLIDDVMTTGATAHTCTEVLLRAGAERVDVLTLAKVTLEL